MKVKAGFIPVLTLLVSFLAIGLHTSQANSQQDEQPPKLLPIQNDVQNKVLNEVQVDLNKQPPKAQLIGKKIEVEDLKEEPFKKQGAFKGKNLMYTTYFYTAGEAVIHGYEKDTKVRIVSLEQKATLWEGVVNPGETKLVSTGRGVFGFLSDKKAAILVGTPSSCTAVGYWVRDEEGSYLSDHFYTQLPSSVSASGARVIVWAWDDVEFSVTNYSKDSLVKSGNLKALEYFEIDNNQLSGMNSNVLEIKADKAKVAVQVYYDEGFFVPSDDGRAAGRRFRTYVGDITEGVNDLNLISYNVTAKAKVTDIVTGEELWSGSIEPGEIRTLTLSKKYVEITSDKEISAVVAPFEHYKQGYAEHHYGVGVEGTGIENDFLLPTPNEIWLFSYFDNNNVRILDGKTGKEIWSGNLMAGHVQGVEPGYGYYRIKSDKGISVMGGDQACGAEYSPAGGLFRVDEELLKVATQILEERKAKAKMEGKVLSEQELNAPLNGPERKKARDYIKTNTGSDLGDEEIEQRMNDMVTY